MSVINAVPLLAGAGVDGYQISRSVRFRSSASAYLNRTFSTPTNQKKWTLSCWVKRGLLGLGDIFNGAQSGTNDNYIRFTGGNALMMGSYNGAGTDYGIVTTAVFRDLSAWYHCVFVYDVDNATSADRAIIYVNGVRQAVSNNGNGMFPSGYASASWNTAVSHRISSNAPSAVYADQYLTEMVFVDGQALTPSSFGENDLITGVWKPKKYLGTYGNNGFYLPFSNNGSVEALGYDTSSLSPELISNGMFVSNVTGWTAFGSGSPAITWLSTHGIRVSNSANNGAYAYTAISTVVGQTYYAQAYVTAAAIGGSTRSVGLLKSDDTAFSVNTATLASTTQGSAPAALRNTFVATATTTYIWLNGDVLGTGTTGADFTQVSVSLGGYKSNWNPFNVSLTAGVTYDSMIDTPTMYADGGNGRGNYCVLNPLAVVTNQTGTYTDGNLTYTTPASTYGSCASTIPIPTTGKWYCEVTPTSAPTYWWFIGLCEYSVNGGPLYSNTNAVSYYSGNGNKYVDNTNSAYGASYTTNDIIGIAVDADAGTVTFYKNNVSQGAISHAVAGLFFSAGDASTGGSSTAAFNFGQRPFIYTPPTGFKALNTQNLPDSTIKKGNQYFDSTTYTANAGVQTIVNAGGFQPDMVWTKSRTGAYSHELFDSVRGVNAFLGPNQTTSETLGTAQLTSFNSNGYTLGANENSNFTSGYAGVGWQWKKGATQGFDIVTYTGNGASSRAIAHALNAVPAFQIVKSRTNGTANWLVRNKSMAQGYTVYLNLTNAQDAGSSQWGASPPDASNFYVGFQAGATGSNNNGDTYVAYLFSEVAGFSKFGSYTGNGSADGPFVYCGFRPRYVLLKRSDSTGNWFIWDSARDPYNTVLRELYSDSNSAEVTRSGSSDSLDLLSNGFKIRLSSTYADRNASGGTYIFMAFAENPFKNALAR